WHHAGRASVTERWRPRLAPHAAHRLVYWSVIRLLEQAVYSGPATVWAISRRDAAELEARFGRPRGSVPALPHGVDTGHFCPEARRERRHAAQRRLGVEGRRVLLLVGNDARNKGVDAAVRALSLFSRNVVLA